MSSSVFFKFKSQKEPTRVEFDGTGISVFELKREIITKSGLGDGTDFDLHIYTDDNSEEYDDDTTIIPRSTTVIARRQPASKPGAGRAARYVSGKMPIAAKNASRKEQSAKVSSSKPSATALNQMSNAMTEEERMAAMFNAQTEQWSAQQEELSHQAPVYKPGAKPGRPANVPDHEPPTGYICYRCGQKGHWIQLCPTNDDPEFDNRPRVKRTTGIPRSFLQKVDKSVVMAQTEGDESKRPAGIMVNAEGDFVIAEPDKASWEQFQAKTKSSSAANETAAAADKEIQERGLECSIDKKMFIEPMKTPCCEKTFCNDCITNALIESDFVCPACQTEAVLIDDLVPDEQASKKIQEYLKEKEMAKPEPANSPKPEAEEANKEDQDTKVDENKSENKDTQETTAEDTKTEKSKSPTPSTATKSPEATKASPATSTAEVAKANDPNSKKRSADDVLENPKIPKGPRAMQNQQPQNNMNMMNGMGMNNMMFPGMPMMPNMMGMPNMNMNMNNMNNMNMGMGMGMPMMGMPMMGMPGFNNNFGNMNNGWNNNMGNMNMNMGMGMGMGMNGNGFQNGGGNFNNQGNGNGGGPEDDAYFRKPVNPHRHQNKQKRVRPSDYREL